MVARVEPLARQSDAWATIFPKPADLVVSASYSPLHLPLRVDALHLRAEAWAGSDEDAREIADKANVFLAMFRSAELSVAAPGSDADVKALFDSLQVRQEGNRAILGAILPGAILRKLGESPEQMQDFGTPPVPAQRQRPR
jgi:hypothetical protein